MFVGLVKENIMAISESKISNLFPEEARVAPRRSLAEEAADTLREMILLEKLAPGMAFSERDVAEALGISRTPLKEAVRTLEHEGLIEFGPTRRPRIADPPLDELVQNLAVLGCLESLAGELACRHATDKEITEISKLCKKMSQANDAIDPLKYFRWDMEFHREIVLASRNTSLISTHAQYNARLWRARFISSKRRGERDSTLGQHVDIVAALQQRNSSEAGQQMRRHLETTVVNISTALKTTD
jgi:DNA-binding GntR family transcriptional regulator